MDTDDLDILAAYPVRRHRPTIRDYHRLAEVGLPGDNARVELLQGRLVDMSPIGPRHALVIDILTDIFIRAATGTGLHVRPQNPIVLDDGSEPRPDLTLVRKPWSGYPTAHPRPEDVLLVIEVADTSLPTDAGAKLALYAQAGISKYWVVDLIAVVVIVHRRPEGLRDATMTRVDQKGDAESGGDRRVDSSGALDPGVSSNHR